MIGDVKKKKKNPQLVSEMQQIISQILTFALTQSHLYLQLLVNNSASKLKSWAYFIMNVVIFYAALGQNKIS